jgi:3-isopropylmalate/(R)-2-methylmalate dehydratase small subunit
MKGRCWIFGDNVNTDLIVPARYLNRTDPKFLASHCMEDADPQFVKKIKAGDVIVAGDNFGCGSSREHAPIAIKAAKISCVIAKSFARIFFRNAINIGLPIFESPQAVADASQGDQMEVDMAKGEIRNLTKSKSYRIEPYPPQMQEIIQAGGLMAFVAKKVAGKTS